MEVIFYPSYQAARSSSSPARSTPDGHAAELRKVPELASLGSVFRSTPPVALTESETEYLVACTKHILDEYIVLEFSITNTITDQLLTEVCLLQRSRLECTSCFICKTGVSLEFAGEGSSAYEVISSIKVPQLRCGASVSLWYVSWNRRDKSIMGHSPSRRRRSQGCCRSVFCRAEVSCY